jgi:hypothetical protein
LICADVAQQHVHTSRGEPLRDAGAHHARPNHGGLAHRAALRRLPPPGAILQEEHANEIAADVPLREARNGLPLRFERTRNAARQRLRDHIDRRKRRGIMAARLFENAFPRLRGDDRSRHGPCAVDRTPRLPAQDELPRKSNKPLARTQRIDDAKPPRLFREEKLSAKDDFQSARQSDEARQPRRAAPGRNNAEIHLGQSDARGGIGTRHAPVARERNLEPAAGAGAMNRGHRHARQRGQLREGLLPKCDELLAILRGRELPQVRSGDEDRRLRADKNDAARVLEACKQLVEQTQRGGIEDVRRAARAVEAQQRDFIGADLERDRRRS